MSESKLSDMPFLDHLEELRHRLIKSIAAVLLLSIVALIFSDRLMNLLAAPVGKVYFMAPTEAFMVQIKIAMLAGVLAAAPVLLYQLWMFVLPGLYDQEVKAVIPVVLASLIFFYGGGAFCLFYVIPLAMKFLMQFGGGRIEPLISVGQYFSFVTHMVLAFAVVFELPVVSYFLGRIGIITSGTLARGRRYAIVLILVVAAVITPTTDLFSQAALAVPLYILYELSILIVHYTGRRRNSDNNSDVKNENKSGDPYAG